MSRKYRIGTKHHAHFVIDSRKEWMLWIAKSRQKEEYQQLSIYIRTPYQQAGFVS